MQKIYVIGRLVKDAVLFDTGIPGKKYLCFTVLVTGLDGFKQTKTLYDVTLASMTDYAFLRTGKKVYIEGRPSCRAFVTKEGKCCTKMKIIAEEVEIIGKERTDYMVSFSSIKTL